MAALVNASTKKFLDDNVDTLESDSFAVGGSNRVLYVGIGTGAGDPTDPTAVKWGGSGGTSLTQIGSTLDLGSNSKMSMWRLIAPTATTSTIHITWAGNQDERYLIGIAVEDADQGTPNGAVASATGTNTTPSVAASSVAGDLVLDFTAQLDISGSSRLYTVDGSQSSLQEIEQQFEGAAASSETAAGASTTMSWSLNGAVDEWGIFAFAVNAAGGGGAASVGKGLLQGKGLNRLRLVA